MNKEWKTEKELLKYAQTIKGKTFKEIGIEKSKKNKGSIGQQVEKVFFRIKNNSKSKPDFEKLGIELKVTPLKVNKNGTIVHKERLTLCNINFKKDICINYKASNLYKKTKKILIVYYVDNSKTPYLHDIFVDAFLWEPWGKENEKRLKRDYEIITNLINQSKANELSGRSTKFLEACTSGKNSKDLTEQLDLTKAKRRKYAFKTRFLNELIEKHNINISKIPIIPEKYFVFLENITKSIKDKNIKEILEEHNLNITQNSKNILNTMMRKIIPLYKVDIRDFKNKNISFHCVRINKKNKIVESLSLPYQQNFMNWMQIEWKESKWKKYLKNHKFIFFVFVKTILGSYVFKEIKFYSLSLYELKQFEKTYNKMNKILKEGVKIIEINRRKTNNFPKKRENPVCHIRPKAKEASYFKSSSSWILPNPISQYKYMTKQTFWINNTWLEKILI